MYEPPDMVQGEAGNTPDFSRRLNIVSFPLKFTL